MESIGFPRDFLLLGTNASRDKKTIKVSVENMTVKSEAKRRLKCPSCNSPLTDQPTTSDLYRTVKCYNVNKNTKRLCKFDGWWLVGKMQIISKKFTRYRDQVTGEYKKEPEIYSCEYV